MGGLGNQLFQIFAIIAYSIQHNEPFMFSYTEIISRDPDRPSYWNNMLIYLKKYTNFDGLVSTEKLESFPTCKGEHGYVPIPTIHDVNVAFSGYFQSYRYFENEYTQIYKLLRIDKLKSSLQLNPSPIETSISMHFRIGDYMDKQCYHPVIPIAYYKRSLEHIIQTTMNNVNYQVFVFCEKESIEYVSIVIEELRYHFPSVSFLFIEEHCDWKQMLLMGKCDHHIIANSTFSWWGAKLSTDTIDHNGSKIVCYPSVWHGHLLYYIDTSELFPPSWTRIEIHADEMDMSHCRCAELLSLGIYSI